MGKSEEERREKARKQDLQIVRDVYAGHYDEYFEQHPPEQLLREARGDEAVDKLIAILKKKKSSEQQGQEQQEKNEPIFLTRLTDIEDPQYAGKEVICRAIIASNSVPYYVPKQLQVWCRSTGDSHVGHKGDYVVELGADQEMTLSHYHQNRYGRPTEHAKIYQRVTPAYSSEAVFDPESSQWTTW